MKLLQSEEAAACVLADLADEDSISAVVQTVGQQIGPDGLNLLINNAAINKPDVQASLVNTGKRDLMAVFEVAGPFLLTKVALSHLHFYHTHFYFTVSNMFSQQNASNKHT